ncbi:MAG: enoyl-CoA hydratase/isomerase family protein [Deltaproteobacteria bacterium]|nr:enoyl-CoA hydratase/isomerase family protein [Deltaproteobacteria bacterium]
MRLELRQDVAIVRLEAGRANAMGTAFLTKLGDLVDAFESGDAKAGVVIGYEKFFSAGLDLTEVVGYDRDTMRRFMGAFEAVMSRVFACPKPLVAAINGHALAGGCVLAVQADVRVMTDAPVKIGLNETQLGIGMPAAVVESARTALPPASLQALIAEGRLFSPHEALAAGLVDEVAPAASLESRALERAALLASIAGPGYTQVKAAIRAPARERMRANAESELERWLDTWFSDNARAKISAAATRVRKGA